MQTITPEQFLEWTRDSNRSEVVDKESAFQIGLRIGFKEYLCNLEDFTAEQGRIFVGRYRAREFRFAWPGDFTIAPMFVRAINTRLTAKPETPPSAAELKEPGTFVVPSEAEVARLFPQAKLHQQAKPQPVEPPSMVEMPDEDWIEGGKKGPVSL